MICGDGEMHRTLCLGRKVKEFFGEMWCVGVAMGRDGGKGQVPQAPGTEEPS